MSWDSLVAFVSPQSSTPRDKKHLGEQQRSQGEDRAQPFGYHTTVDPGAPSGSITGGKRSVPAPREEAVNCHQVCSQSPPSWTNQVMLGNRLIIVFSVSQRSPLTSISPEASSTILCSAASSGLAWSWVVSNFTCSTLAACASRTKTRTQWMHDNT